MQMTIQGRTLLAALGILAATLLAWPHAIRGQEPKRTCELRVELKGDSIPLLAQIPYLGRLFESSGRKPRCAEELERIGVDVHVVDGQAFEFHGPIGLGAADCQVCPLPKGWPFLTAGACAEPACDVAVVKCGAAKCCTTNCCEAGCGQETSAVNVAACKCPPQSASWEEITELVAENAAMEATLEAHEALLEAKSEMFEALAEMMVEKARLEAKLEMVEHRDAMLKEMVELQAENAKLKAHAELAQHKEELLKAQLATVLENERLKQRIAELEQRQEAEVEPVHTAKKPQKTKKAR